MIFVFLFTFSYSESTFLRALNERVTKVLTKVGLVLDPDRFWRGRRKRCSTRDKTHSSQAIACSLINDDLNEVVP